MVCPACGKELPGEFPFCPFCGAALEPATAGSAHDERKVVTALFADLVGFTSRAERLDPEDVHALLAPYHARLRSELERFGGTVEKFIGDAVMALFGAPTAHEDDPERAVRAALAIREFASEEGLELRIGINTGEALIRVGARPGEGETMATGDVVNTAARLQSAAPVGGILVGEQTYRATDRAIEYQETEPIEAKGKAERVPAWVAVQARSRVSVERVHGAALVGRRRELDLLGDALDRSRQEHSPQLVTLVGVPGIGKSRLVIELAGRIENETELTSWRQGRCLPYGEGVTFWALGEMVKAQAGILEGDDASEAERKLRVAVDDPWVESHLRPLVGVAGGSERRDEAFAAWRRFFEGLAEERPLVLVFEDLHWADENLLDFIDHLVEWATGVALLVVCTARPELLARRPGWGGGKSNALTISLSPLSNEDTARLLGDLLDRALLPAQTQEELLTRAGGNPLYAEEYARALRERGHVAELPETVQGMIAARLDLLEPGEKALLQDASVVGKTFWAGAAGSLARLEAGLVAELLHALERKEFVSRERLSSVGGDVEFSFRHLLVRDVAYGQIPRAERVEKHRRAAGWLEGLGRPEDNAEMLAHHYLQALELGAAAGVDTGAFAASARSALAHAGDRAFALNAYDASVRYSRAALDLLPEPGLLRGRVLFRLGRALHMLRGADVGVLERAVEELSAAGDVEGTAEAERTLAEHFWESGDRDRALEYLEQARTLVDPLPSSPAKAYTIGTASRFRMLASDDAEAIRLGSEALAMAEELGLDELRAAALNNLGSSRAATGDAKRGLAEMAQAITVAGEANSPFELFRAKGNLAANLWLIGDLAEGARLWRESYEEAAGYGQHVFDRWIRGINVGVCVALGKWDEAVAEADAFAREVEAGLPHYLAPQIYIGRALIRLARAEDASVLADAEQALALANRAGDPQNLYPVLAGAAHVYSELGDTKRAAELAGDFLAALASSEGLGFGLTSVHVLAWTLADVGRGPELAAALSRFPDVPWARAAAAFAHGDPLGAAEICAEMGAQHEEAYARLAAGRMLAERGRQVEADEQLRRALSFYTSVGATRYVREGASLLAASA